MNQAIIIFALGITISGCAAKAPIIQQENISSNPIEITTPNTTIEWASDRYIDPKQHSIYATNAQIGQTSFSIERYKAYLGLENSGKELAKVSIKYEGTALVAENSAQRKFTLTPNKKIYHAVPDMITGNVAYSVDFPLNELMSFLSMGHVQLKIESNSKYQPEAIISNFNRLSNLRGNISNKSAGALKAVFLIKIGSQAIPVEVNVFPYQTGSKVIATAIVNGKVSGNTIDFISPYTCLREEINKIINS